MPATTVRQELLTSDRMRTRISELRSQFNYVLMDVASFNACNHAMVFGGLADGVVLVLKANSTRRDATRETMQQLQASKCGSRCGLESAHLPDS